MRQTFCSNPNCDRSTRTNDKFIPGKCPHCGKGEKLINIKGSGELHMVKPEGDFVDAKGHSTIPRRIRPVKADGSPKSKFPP